MYMNLFRKKNDDRYRYWASVSTKGYDYKKKKQTDEYVNATMPVRVLPDLEDSIEWTKTKNKKIELARLKEVEGFFEAIQPNEGEPFVRFVVVEASMSEDD